MSPEASFPRVIIIVGPTGVGKTGLAIQLARALDGEVVSADSRYLYRGMDIGTAKPTREEMAGVPHHMIDVAEPNETWSLAQYFENSKAVIQEILARGRTPIVVGGTGQYYRALTQGWTIPPAAPDDGLRDCLEQWGNEIGKWELHRKLAIIDPEAAGFIQAENMRRTVRALEVIFSTGRKFSEQRQATKSDLEFWTIGLILPREVLFRKVDERIDRMFSQGLVEEVKALQARGYGCHNPSMSAIGYQEVLQYLDGNISMNEAIMLMKSKTHQFIRRQANWFKTTDPQIHWYRVGDDPLPVILKDLKKERDEE